MPAYQTSPMVVSLKGRLPKKLQSKSTLSCKIVQIHCVFRHFFFFFLLRNRIQNLTEIENRRIIFLCDGFRKTELRIDLIANAFRGSI